MYPGHKPNPLPTYEASGSEGREEYPGVASYPRLVEEGREEYPGVASHVTQEQSPALPLSILNLSMGHHFKWSRSERKATDCTQSIKTHSEIVSGSDSAERRSGLLIVSAKRIKQHS